MTKVIAISAGHNKIVPGAISSYGDEQEENRRVVAQLIKLLRARGNKVVDCTDDASATKQRILNTVAKRHGAVMADHHIQIHFNSGASTANGCEVLFHKKHGNEKAAATLSDMIADAAGFRDRGAKARDDLFWLNSTKTGLLIEVCFVSNREDMAKYREKFAHICAAIADYLSPIVKVPDEPNKDDNGKNERLGVVTLDKELMVYSEPTAASKIVRALPRGSSWYAYEDKAGFYCISAGQWVMKKYCSFKPF